MTFFLHHGGFPKVACVVRDGTVAGICLFWFPEQPIFTFLSSQTEENSGPALAGLVLQMREDLPLDSYIVIGISHWTHIFLKWKNRESPEANKLNSWVSLLSFFGGGGGEVNTVLPTFGRSLVAPCSTIGEDMIAKQGWQVKQTWHFCVTTCLRNSIPDGYMRDPRPQILKLAHGDVKDHLKKIFLFVWRCHEGYTVSVWGLDHPHLLSHLMIYLFMT